MLHKQRRFSKIAMAGLFPLLMLTSIACEDDSEKAIASAQDCLNEMRSSMSSTALASKAAECRTKLGTATTAKAFVIECSSYFLEEGFFGSKVLESFTRIDDTSNSNNDSLNLLSTFAFSSESNASLANTACQQTGVKTLQSFGDMAQASTFIGAQFAGGLSALLSGGTPSVDDFKTALGNIDTAAEFETLGSTVTSLATNLCSSETDSGLGEESCKTLEAVTSSTSSAVVGQCMQECMSGTTASGSACSVDSSITCP